MYKIVSKELTSKEQESNTKPFDIKTHHAESISYVRKLLIRIDGQKYDISTTTVIFISKAFLFF